MVDDEKIAFLASIRYEPLTGKLYRKKVAGNQAPGVIAGFVDAYGYICVGIRGKYYKAHRVAWFLFYGKWPTGQIDHINRNKSDNRIINLRDANQQINSRNHPLRKDNISQVRGVGWCERKGKWIARIGGKPRKYLGATVNLFEAVCLRKSAEAKEGGY